MSATNSGGTGTATLALTVSPSAPPAPVITSTLTASAVKGSPFSYQITATNSPTSFNATGLPAGLTVSTSSGLISGTPTASGSFSVALSATNSGGTGTATLALTVNPAVPPAPVITSTLTATAVKGSPFSYQITATNNPVSFNATGLAAGLMVSSTTGLISGTPTASGSFSVTLSAANSGGTGTATLALTVNLPAPVITSALTASAVKGTAFSYQITATNSPTSFNATGLPSGLTVSTSSGLISGTPTASGSFSVTLSAVNSGGTGTATLALTVNPPAPVITSSLNATASIGTAFSYQITASNNPTSFNATGLPAGLTVDTGSGLISGTPTAVGASTVTLTATNATGSGTAALALTINDTTPPTVSIVAPQSGALVARIVTLVAAASDNVKVASVQFKVDGKNVGAPATAADPYTCYPAPIVNPMLLQAPYCATGMYSAKWDTTTSTNGLHVLTATAVDPSGNAATSASVTVRVVNLWVRLSWDPLNPDTARLGLETADPAFPNGPTVTASIQLPSGTKSATLTRISTAPATYDLGLPGVNFSSSDFFSLNGTLPTVTVGTQTFTAMGLGGGVTPIMGGRIQEANGAAQVTVLPGNLTQEAQIAINPMPVGFYTQASGASSAASRQNLKLLDAGRDVVMATSGTLSTAMLTLPFDATLLPPGRTLADVRIAYFNANTGQWEIQGNASVVGGVVSVQVLHFSPYAPIVVMASAAPGLNAAVVYPNPAVSPADPTIRVCPGIVDSVDITVFDVSGRVVHSATIAGSASFTPLAGEGTGQFCYEHVWTGSKASGIYHAVVHAKGGGTTVKARLGFAVVR